MVKFMPKIIHVVPNYYPKFGGSVKTVSDFLKADLNAEVISFDTEILKDRLPFDKRAHHIKTGKYPWNKDTHFLSKIAEVTAEEIATNADLIFCHQLFRAHNSWVKSFCKRKNSLCSCSSWRNGPLGLYLPCL